MQNNTKKIWITFRQRKNDNSVLFQNFGVISFILDTNNVFEVTYELQIYEFIQKYY